jgi:hypothetical protein
MECVSHVLCSAMFCVFSVQMRLLSQLKIMNAAGPMSYSRIIPILEYILTTFFYPFLESHCMALDSSHDVAICQGTAIFAELFRRHLPRTVLHSSNSGNLKWDSCMSTIVCVMCGKNWKNHISELLINIFSYISHHFPHLFHLDTYLCWFRADFRSDSTIAGWKLPAPCGNMFIKCRKMHLPGTKWHITCFYQISIAFNVALVDCHVLIVTNCSMDSHGNSWNILISTTEMVMISPGCRPEVRNRHDQIRNHSGTALNPIRDTSRGFDMI